MSFPATRGYASEARPAAVSLLLAQGSLGTWVTLSPEITVMPVSHQSPSVHGRSAPCSKRANVWE